VTSKRSNVFRGKWRIVSTDTWAAKELDTLGPAYITFDAGGHGELKLLVITASGRLFIHEGDEAEFTAQAFSDQRKARA